MPNVNTSYQSADTYGTPAFEELDTLVDSNLLAGSEPKLSPTSRILLGDSLDLAQFTVVGIAAGKLVKATYNATLGSAVVPVGVLAHAASSGAANTSVYGELLPGGCFNAGSDDAGTDSPLVWDASFDTLAKKTTWEGVLQNLATLVFRSRLGGNAS
ncbi:hypothetical protein I5E68_09970 [Novosphingobium sp. YJ-S2-02]|uniref:Head decoration protein n=1 Tax=Novosphingobium aureum TaxID=2792964 RepID=A0A931MKT7_9SPHN|nr:hypothetical protein [Novosphingobium aureum]MBH0113272.1 hypothetical protein [Novosphingobium aureum]